MCVGLAFPIPGICRHVTEGTEAWVWAREYN